MNYLTKFYIGQYTLGTYAQVAYLPIDPTVVHTYRKSGLQKIYIGIMFIEEMHTYLVNDTAIYFCDAKIANEAK